MSCADDRKYRAFLSYATADIRWSKTLHRLLERYRIDRDLVGRKTSVGAVPKTLRPVFRDRDDFTGGNNLKDATIEALRQSAALIVLCSPVAATRPAVNEEVRLFRSLYPERPVVPVVIAGEFPSNYPPALRYEIARDGSVSDRPVEILGIDLRKTGDGKALGLAKVIGGVIGVGTDEIVRRAQQEQRKRLRNWVVSLSLMALTFAGLAVWAELNQREAVEQRRVADQRRAEAERNFALAKETAESLVFDIARDLRDVEGMRMEAVEKILGSARTTFDNLVEGSSENSQLERSRAAMLSLFGETYLARGNLDEALKSHQEALSIVRHLTTIDPNIVEWQYDVSASLEQIGDVLIAQGNIPAGREQYHMSLDNRRAMPKVVQEQMRWSFELATLLTKIGVALHSQGNSRDAMENYQTARDLLQIISNTPKANADALGNLSAVETLVGDLLRDEGKDEEALKSYQDAIKIDTQLATTNPISISRQRGRIISLLRTGEIFFNRGDFPKALEAFNDGLVQLDRLAKIDPGNTSWQHDLGVLHYKIARTLAAQGERKAALDEFRHSIAISERLTKLDPTNAEELHSQSITYMDLGDTYFDMQDQPQALTAYRNASDIVSRLAKSDPSNVNWQSDVSTTQERIGDVLLQQGQLDEALKIFSASLAIYEKLSNDNPSNIDWIRNIAIAQEHIGSVLWKKKIPDKAKKFFQKASIKYSMILHNRPGDEYTKLLSIVPIMKLALVDPGRTELYFRQGEAILKPLADAGHLDAQHRQWLAQIEAFLGKSRASVKRKR